MRRIIFALPCFALALLLGGWMWVGATPHPLLIDTAGHEDLQEGAVLVNGFNVGNYGDATIRATYERYQGFLGEPLAGFDGSAQLFRMGQLRYTPSNPPDWRVEFDNLGWLDMQLAGYTPTPGRTPHPALRDWLQSQREAGLDTPRLIGRIISDPICEKPTAICTQWTDKQRFSVPADATSGEQVQRQPLGLWFAHPPARPAASDPRAPSLPLLIVAIAAGLLGLLLLLPRSTGGNSSSALV